MCVIMVIPKLCGAINNNYQQNFRGTPQKIYGGVVKNYQDALIWWEKLRYAKYLDAHFNSDYDKAIRAENYSFLDKLTSYADKSAFIEKFCEFTKFPNVKAVSEKIDSTFKNCVKDVAAKLNSTYRENCFNIIDNGYDPTCSVALKKSFPGSDLDKGYIILEGNSNWLDDKEVTNRFAGGLWDNLDQRIASLNHKNTFPSIYTKKQVENMLDKLDLKAQKVESDSMKKGALKTLGVTLLGTALGGFGIALGSAYLALVLSNAQQDREKVVTDPYEAAGINRAIAKKLETPEEREEAKNFAFFIETVLANIWKFPSGKDNSFFSRIKDSLFAVSSNVTQVKAWQKKIDGGYLKNKLRKRMQLQNDFNKMSTDTKYNLVKDVIKYCTDEQSNMFNEYFRNDDDIDLRYERLLDSLK